MKLQLQNFRSGAARLSSHLVGFCAAPAMALCFALCPFPSHAQGQFPAPPMAGANPHSGRPVDPAMRSMLHKMQEERNTSRQKKIEADTAQLLSLAKELHAAVSQSDKNTLSIDVVKDAEQIEKLAKGIKEKMRNGSY